MKRGRQGTSQVKGWSATGGDICTKGLGDLDSIEGVHVETDISDGNDGREYWNGGAGIAFS